jgi:hypothetical protein
VTEGPRQHNQAGTVQRQEARRHHVVPLPNTRKQHQRRNRAIAAYQAAGLVVSVLGEAALSPGPEAAAAADAALAACLAANEALLHRAVLRRPLSVLKYAMTLDGKIATGVLVGARIVASSGRATTADTTYLITLPSIQHPSATRRPASRGTLCVGQQPRQPCRGV